MSILGKIWRSTLLVSGATLMARVGTFLSNVAIIRLLGNERVGQLGLIESWLNLAMMFGLLGIGAAATKHISQYLETDPERAGSMAGAALLIAGGISLAVGVLVYAGLRVGAFSFAGATQRVLGGCSLILLPLIVVLALKQVITGVVYGLQSFQALITANLAVGLVAVPASYLLVRRSAVAGALQARFALTLVETILLAWACWTSFRSAGGKISLKRLWSNGSQLLAFGFPTFVGQLAAGPIQTLAMSLLASQPGGLYQVGLLTTANRLCSLSNFLPSSMGSTLVPILSGEWGSGELARFREGARLALRMLWLSALPIIAFFLAASPTLLHWLYGREFAVGWPIAFALLMVVLIGSINEIGDRGLAAAGRIWLSTANNFAGMVLFVLGAMWLIPRCLGLGYAMAYALSFTLYVALQMWWLRRLFQIPLAALRPIAFVTLAVAAVAWLVASRTTSWAQFALALCLTILSLVVEWRWFPSSPERRVLFLGWRRVRSRGTMLSSRILAALKGC